MPVNEALLHNAFYGNYGVRLTAAIGFAFLMGSIPAGPVVRWLFADFDARVRRVAATIVAPLNALKGWIPVAIALHGAGLPVALWCASAAVVGHAFSPWRRLRGGTGADLLIGTLLALNPAAAAVVTAFWCAAAVPLGSADAGTLFATALAFFPLWYFDGPTAAGFGALAAAAVGLRSAVGGQPLQRRNVENLDRTAAARGDHPALL